MRRNAPSKANTCPSSLVSTCICCYIPISQISKGPSGNHATHSEDYLQKKDPPRPAVDVHGGPCLPRLTHKSTGRSLHLPVTCDITPSSIMTPSLAPIEPLSLSFPVPRHPHLNLQVHLTLLEHCSMVHLTTSTIGEGASTHAPLGSFVYAMPDVRTCPNILSIALPSSHSTPSRSSNNNSTDDVILATRHPRLNLHRAHNRRLQHRLRHAGIEDPGAATEPARVCGVQYEFRRADGGGGDGGRCGGGEGGRCGGGAVAGR
jgi:hypothetical protein